MNKEEFINELKKINININDKQLNQLDEYYHLLIEENKKYNLTSITEKNEVYLKHFYDSLTITKIIDLNNESLCDIGTGAGFPGIVLKIIYPNLKITLIDSNNKKIYFLNKIIKELNLQKIEVIQTRAEDYGKKIREKYDIVTSRAVAPLKHLLEYSIPLVKVKGYYIAMKSDLEKELIDINKYEKELNIIEKKRLSFHLPKENSLRTLLLYQKERITNTKYPRKYMEIKKKSI